jgi:hypothetical protein
MLCAINSDAFSGHSSYQYSHQQFDYRSRTAAKITPWLHQQCRGQLKADDYKFEMEASCRELLKSLIFYEECLTTCRWEFMCG